MPGANGKPWPVDRVLAEKSLDLSRFLEPSMAGLKDVPQATKRVTLGSVPEQITEVAKENHADLIVMSPRRRRGLRFLLFGSVTDTVSRTSPCPVLAHEIANQLTVINLSCFKVRGAAAKVLPASSLSDLERVERAVADITALVETLRRLDDQPERLPQPASSQQPSNVYPLFEPA